MGTVRPLRGRFSVNPILPPKGKPKLKASTLYLPEALWQRLSDIADETKTDDPEGKGYNRNEVALHFLEWAEREYSAQRAEARKKAAKK